MEGYHDGRNTVTGNGSHASCDSPRGPPVKETPVKAMSPPYAFDLVDESRWSKHLQHHGYVVIRGVANAEQVAEARSLFWDAISERHDQVVRDDPGTWGFPTHNVAGLTAWLAQSAGAWAVRGWPGLKRTFAHIWQEEDLIVSMDCVIFWRPWWLQEADSSWKPYSEGLHLDQNPFTKPGLECIQGMVPLLPVTERSGGLQVVPDSHLDESKEAFKLKHPHMRSSGDWCPCDDQDLREKALLLFAEPGDLILWDSRTVHGGLVGKGNYQQDEPVELARLSVPVAMTPRKWASALVQQRRREGFEKGGTFNHCPHEAGTSTGTVRAPIRRNYKPVALTEEQFQLL